jgi:hypothetical protein
MQENRRRRAKARLDEAARQYIQAVHEERNHEWDPKHFGFEFTLGEIELRAIDLKPDLFAEYEQSLREQRLAA